jgi:hypothetical protein
MPYKHIATHLKKTELACRLHYHQLCRSSNRRKRATSVSSSSSMHSPMIRPSSVHESASGPSTPVSYRNSPDAQYVRLPPAASLLSRPTSYSPQRSLSEPIAILPKPSPPRQTSIASSLRLDCATQTLTCIDHERLYHIYESHRAAFWGAIAAEYGQGVDPRALEEAWRHGPSIGRSSMSIEINTPPTPCTSPDAGNVCQREEKAGIVEHRSNATSIAALLGIDASPRSPDERELVKRIEEGRI